MLRLIPAQIKLVEVNVVKGGCLAGCFSELKTSLIKT